MPKFINFLKQCLPFSKKKENKGSSPSEPATLPGGEAAGLGLNLDQLSIRKFKSSRLYHQYMFQYGLDPDYHDKFLGFARVYDSLTETKDEESNEFVDLLVTDIDETVSTNLQKIKLFFKFVHQDPDFFTRNKVVIRQNFRWVFDQFKDAGSSDSWKPLVEILGGLSVGVARDLNREQLKLLLPYVKFLQNHKAWFQENQQKILANLPVFIEFLKSLKTQCNKDLKTFRLTPKQSEVLMHFLEFKVNGGSFVLAQSPFSECGALVVLGCSQYLHKYKNYLTAKTYDLFITGRSEPYFKAALWLEHSVGLDCGFINDCLGGNPGLIKAIGACPPEVKAWLVDNKGFVAENAVLVFKMVDILLSKNANLKLKHLELIKSYSAVNLKGKPYFDSKNDPWFSLRNAEFLVENAGWIIPNIEDFDNKAMRSTKHCSVHDLKKNPFVCHLLRQEYQFLELDEGGWLKGIKGHLNQRNTPVIIELLKILDRSEGVSIQTKKYLVELVLGQNFQNWYLSGPGNRAYFKNNVKDILATLQAEKVGCFYNIGNQLEVIKAYKDLKVRGRDFFKVAFNSLNNPDLVSFMLKHKDWLIPNVPHILTCIGGDLRTSIWPQLYERNSLARVLRKDFALLSENGKEWFLDTINSLSDLTINYLMKIWNFLGGRVPLTMNQKKEVVSCLKKHEASFKELGYPEVMIQYIVDNPKPLSELLQKFEEVNTNFNHSKQYIIDNCQELMRYQKELKNIPDKFFLAMLLKFVDKRKSSPDAVLPDIAKLTAILSACESIEFGKENQNFCDYVMNDTERLFTEKDQNNEINSARIIRLFELRNLVQVNDLVNMHATINYTQQQFEQDCVELKQEHGMDAGSFSRMQADQEKQIVIKYARQYMRAHATTSFWSRHGKTGLDKTRELISAMLRGDNVTVALQEWVGLSWYSSGSTGNLSRKHFRQMAEAEINALRATNGPQKRAYPCPPPTIASAFQSPNRNQVPVEQNGVHVCRY